jgi:hypothetical protein|tara:strand:+ start:254 stop:397 length:144 start_codon:yes stop_codon:yes gene_type:complete
MAGMMKAKRMRAGGGVKKGKDTQTSDLTNEHKRNAMKSPDSAKVRGA